MPSEIHPQQPSTVYTYRLNGLGMLPGPSNIELNHSYIAKSLRDIPQYLEVVAHEDIRGHLEWVEVRTYTYTWYWV